jgi:ribosomal protein L16 Arg81 hydroxylase
MPAFHVLPESHGQLAPPWSFASLIDPVSPDEFRSDYWCAQPLHISRGDASFFAQLITIEDVERQLSTDEVFSRHSVTTPREGYGPPDPPPTSVSELYERLLAGSSVRIRRLECLLDPGTPVLTLLRGMELALQHPRDSLSCYIAPPQATGLGPHHDETEIFTLQISGRKRWRLYGPVDSELPATYDREQLGPPAHDFTLEEGDVLYVPGGVIHDVTNDVPSFSLTVVFDPFRWSALLDLLWRQLAATAEFRAPLPAGVLFADRPHELLSRQLEPRVELVRQALERVSAGALVDDLAQRQVARTTLPPDGQLGVLFELDAITLETVVEKRPSLACHITRRGEKVLLMLPGGYGLEASARAEPALRSVVSMDQPFRVADMDESLGDGAKLALARKLVSCGLLRVA